MLKKNRKIKRTFTLVMEKKATLQHYSTLKKNEVNTNMVKIMRNTKIKRN